MPLTLGPLLQHVLNCELPQCAQILRHAVHERHIGGLVSCRVHFHQMLRLFQLVWIQKPDRLSDGGLVKFAWEDTTEPTTWETTPCRGHLPP